MKRLDFEQWLNEETKKKVTIMIGDTGGVPGGIVPDDDMEDIPDDDDDVALAEPDEELPLNVTKPEPLDLMKLLGPIGGVDTGAELEKVWKPLATGKKRAKPKSKAKAKPKAKKKK